MRLIAREIIILPLVFLCLLFRIIFSILFPDYASSSAMVTIPSACESAIQVRHACSLRASATRASDLERGYGRRMVPLQKSQHTDFKQLFDVRNWLRMVRNQVLFYFRPPEPGMTLVDKSQVISAILAFGGLIGAAFIPIRQFAVAGQISRLESTRSFWEGHRNDVNFREKRYTVRERFKGKDYGEPYINYRRNNQQEPVTYYENFLWLGKRWRDT